MTSMSESLWKHNTSLTYNTILVQPSRSCLTHMHIQRLRSILLQLLIWWNIYAACLNRFYRLVLFNGQNIVRKQFFIILSSFFYNLFLILYDVLCLFQQSFFKFVFLLTHVIEILCLVSIKLTKLTSFCFTLWPFLRNHWSERTFFTFWFHSLLSLLLL